MNTPYMYFFFRYSLPKGKSVAGFFAESIQVEIQLLFSLELKENKRLLVVTTLYHKD